MKFQKIGRVAPLPGLEKLEKKNNASRFDQMDRVGDSNARPRDSELLAIDYFARENTFFILGDGRYAKLLFF